MDAQDRVSRVRVAGMVEAALKNGASGLMVPIADMRLLLNAAERLLLAKKALVDTGYFTEDQVGDDVAPRITEMFSRGKGMTETEIRSAETSLMIGRLTGLARSSSL